MAQKAFLIIFVSDEELVLMIQRGDEFAFEVLFLRYRQLIERFVNKIVNAYPSLSTYSDEVTNCGLDAFTFGVKHFVHAKNASFYKYWKGIAEKKTISFYKKAKPEMFILFDPEIIDSSFARVSDSDLAGKGTSYEYERDDLREIVREHRYVFSCDQYRVINLILMGYSVQEICDAFNYKRGKVYRDRNCAIAILTKIVKKR